MNKCPVCQGSLANDNPAELECECCHQVWIYNGEWWEIVPQKVTNKPIYMSDLKESTECKPSITGFRMRLDMFINSTIYLRPSREVSLAHTHLQRAFMWLGKAQGASGGQSPYKDSFDHKLPNIEPTADHSPTSLMNALWDMPEYGTHTARVKSLRSLISEHLKEFSPFSKAPNEFNDDYAEYLKQSRLAAQEASMWLGWELANIKKQQEHAGQPAGTSPGPASNLPL